MPKEAATEAQEYAKIKERLKYYHRLAGKFSKTY